MTLAYLLAAAALLIGGVVGLIVTRDHGYAWLLAFAGVCWGGALIEAHHAASRRPR